MATGADYEVLEVGVRTPKEVKKDCLSCGEVGWIAASIKTVKDVRVGDTITHADLPAIEPLAGYREMNPMVYCGLYPIETNRYNDLRDALEKLQLNDASLHFEAETSQALGLVSAAAFWGCCIWM